MSSITRMSIAVAVVAAAALAGPAPAAASPDLGATPTAISFADHGIHDGNHENRTVDFEATGATQISSVAIVGADPGQFRVSADRGCTNATLNPGDRCAVDLQFIPSSVGAKTAELLVTDTSGDTEVLLSGTGITGQLASNPNPLVFRAQPYFFGDQQENLNVSNPSPNAATQAGGGTITGPDAARFSIAYGENCFTLLYFSNNGCGLGVRFSPTGPGTFTAQLEISSDATGSPLIVPLSAVALAGPQLVIEPGQLDFGSVGVGQDATRTVRLGNTGDFPLQVQQALFVTGRPDVFFITGDGCTARIVNPGESCTLVAHFKPADAGARDAALFIIGGSQTRPVDNIGVTGTGVIPGAPPVSTPDAPQPGPPGTAAAAGQDLSRLSGAFTDERACRAVRAPRMLRLGGREATIGVGSPATPAAPLTVRAGGVVQVSLDGRVLGRGRTVAINPRALSGFADGEHRLRVSAGAAAAEAPIGLAPCRLAVAGDGGPGRAATLAVSARAGMSSLSLSLSRSLRLRVARGQGLGRGWLKSAGYPARRFALTGARTRSNGVTVRLTSRGIRVSGLPAETGVVHLRLDAGVLSGRGGSVTAVATLQGDRTPSRASAPVGWVR